MSKFTLTAFADEICDGLDGQMDALERHGIRFIELRGVDGKNVSSLTLEEAGDVRRRMTARGFAVSAVGSPVGKTFIDDEFGPALAQFKHVAALAKALGTRYIRVFSFYIPEGDDPARWRDEVLRRMRAMADHAEREGIVLLHENEKAIYGDLPERCADIFGAVNSLALWATYDPSNFVQCGARNYPDAFRLLRGRIRYVHMKDSVYAAKSGEAAGADAGFDTHVVSDAHRPAGRGDGNCREILRDLWREGYEGFLSIEPHLINNRDIPGGPEEKFAVAAEALKELIREATAK